MRVGWSYATQQEKKDESQQTEIKELKVINKELKDELSKKEKHIVDLERDLAVSKFIDIQILIEYNMPTLLTGHILKASSSY